MVDELHERPPPEGSQPPGSDPQEPDLDAQPPDVLDTSGDEPPSLPRGRDPGFLVVGLGASAGGLQALEAFFSRLPADCGMAFVVVTHQHHGHVSLLPELLGRKTALGVVQVTDGTRLEPGKLYLPPPGTVLTVRGGILRLTAPPPDGPVLLIDRFFRSLAADLGTRAVGIVLSGTGTDGSEGIRAIKGEAGLTLAQDEASAEQVGMPRSAVGTGLIDAVLPPTEMPAYLSAHARSGAVAQDRPLELSGEGLKVLLELLRQRTGHDFSGYKLRTVERRVERRLRLHQLGSLREYSAYARAHPEELDVLFQELLIGVTRFFRDPEVFEALAAGPLPELLAGKPEGYQVRVWVPACSTGEEAYSLAILLEETLQAQDHSLHLQVFATDPNQRAIELARAGRYPEGTAADVSPGRLRRWFVHEDGGYRVHKALRERLVFAPQDALRDPPFTRLDLVSCRNLLIYLQPELQQRLLPLFHYALRPDGLLLLGSSETLGELEGLFKPVDKKRKIFRRLSDGVGKLPELPVRSGAAARSAPGVEPPHPGHAAVGAADRLLLELFAPACVLVDARGEIAFVRGRTGSYLEPAQGQASLNLLDMAREGLRLDLEQALEQAAAERRTVERRGLRVRTNGAWARVDLTVRPVDRHDLRGLFLVTFAPVSAPPPSPEGARPPREEDPLEEELQRTRESLQAAVEELEARNEELKSANEELQSTNEELQSTNEELETSKEEMQSLNEELHTVNAELEGKLQELSQVNDDMTNLLDSTHIATVFLDRRLHVKRFTPKAKELIKLIESDVGRPIDDLVSRLEYRALVEDAREVLRTLSPRALEVRSEGGDWYQTRILPYRTADDRLDGVVITFVDVTDTYVAVEGVVQAVWSPLVVLDGSLRVLTVNASFCRTFGLAREHVLGRELWQLAGSPWSDATLRRLLEEELPHRRAIEGRECPWEAPGQSPGRLRINARHLELRRGLEGRIVLALEVVPPEEAARAV